MEQPKGQVGGAVDPDTPDRGTASPIADREVASHIPAFKAPCAPRAPRYRP